MRRPVDEELIQTFFRAFGAEAKSDSRVYFTGGVTAVLYGWCQSTVDLQIKIIPEQDALFRAIPSLKESLSVNIELALPADFLPELPGWQDRSKYIARKGRISFYHLRFLLSGAFQGGAWARERFGRRPRHDRKKPRLAGESARALRGNPTAPVPVPGDRSQATSTSDRVYLQDLG